ncbi:MAG: hypothetical protein HYV32_01090 [Candidatus Kerfeldbacteria bacterium]|nr:hypothetical protein [Candidatus Kerfeldbacteria bacterium]
MKENERSQEPAEHYTRQLFFPTLVAVILHISMLHAANMALLRLSLYGLMILFICSQGLKQRASWETMTLVAGMNGAITATLVNLYVLFTAFSITALFKLITQTFFTGVITAVAGGLCYILISLVKNTMHQPQQTEKGGEHHG